MPEGRGGHETWCTLPGASWPGGTAWSANTGAQGVDTGAQGADTGAQGVDTADVTVASRGRGADRDLASYSRVN